MVDDRFAGMFGDGRGRGPAPRLLVGDDEYALSAMVEAVAKLTSDDLAAVASARQPDPLVVETARDVLITHKRTDVAEEAMGRLFEALRDSEHASRLVGPCQDLATAFAGRDLFTRASRDALLQVWSASGLRL